MCHVCFTSGPWYTQTQIHTPSYSLSTVQYIQTNTHTQAHISRQTHLNTHTHTHTTHTRKCPTTIQSVNKQNKEIKHYDTQSCVDIECWRLFLCGDVRV